MKSIHYQQNEGMTERENNTTSALFKTCFFFFWECSCPLFEKHPPYFGWPYARLRLWNLPKCMIKQLYGTSHRHVPLEQMTRRRLTQHCKSTQLLVWRHRHNNGNQSHLYTAPYQQFYEQAPTPKVKSPLPFDPTGAGFFLPSPGGFTRL